jgi:hypothetical protein
MWGFRCKLNGGAGSELWANPKSAEARRESLLCTNTEARASAARLAVAMFARMPWWTVPLWASPSDIPWSSYTRAYLCDSPRVSSSPQARSRWGNSGTDQGTQSRALHL